MSALVHTSCSAWNRCCVECLEHAAEIARIAFVLRLVETTPSFAGEAGRECLTEATITKGERRAVALVAFTCWTERLVLIATFGKQRPTSCFEERNEVAERTIGAGAADVVRNRRTSRLWYSHSLHTSC